MAGLLFAPVWLATFIFSLVNAHRNRSQPEIWLVPLILSALVALLSAVAAALSLAA